MQTSQGPTLDETLTFIKRGGGTAEKNAVRQHLENLLYMKSVLYLDDKNNEKHRSRIQAVLEAMKKEYSKELSEVAPAEGMIYLVAQILLANKIIDTGIARVKVRLERGGVPERELEQGRPEPGSSAAVSTAAQKPINQPAALAPSAVEDKDLPKLRETLGFLVSIVGDPLRVTDKIPLHLRNLEKISKLIKRTYQDPKIQKMNDNILAILSKIYGTPERQELNYALDNSIQILKNLPQYKMLITAFETDLKNYLLPAATEGGATTFSRQAQMDKFYAEFKDERNMVKKINMIKAVLTSPTYKYDKELNAASLKLLKGLEGMGLQVGYNLS